ncbi:hypothetical protein EV702DRAFT_1264614 [Suillus placidus]|uniref:Uncharacterized protein n=1 Tax=Suillus placidus TaxID=48579 RepID=A0A9P7A7L2_9AGAM|nr:hypothetical protein EV702DRAFT_1264614 [Suillus placidus]
MYAKFIALYSDDHLQDSSKVKADIAPSKGKDSSKKVQADITPSKGKDSSKVKADIAPSKGKDSSKKVQADITPSKGKDSSKVKADIAPSKGKDSSKKAQASITPSKGKKGEESALAKKTASGTKMSKKAEEVGNNVCLRDLAHTALQSDEDEDDDENKHDDDDDIEDELSTTKGKKTSEEPASGVSDVAVFTWHPTDDFFQNPDVIQLHRHHITEAIEKVIQYDVLPYYKKTPEGEHEHETLLNIVTKLMWTRLGFDPSLEGYPRLDLKTLPSVLTVSVIAAIMLNWHAHKMSKYMRVPKGEPKIKEVSFFAEAIGEVFIWIEGLSAFAVTKGDVHGSGRPWYCAGGAIERYLKIQMGVDDPILKAEYFSMAWQIVTKLHRACRELLPQLKAVMNMYMPSNTEKCSIMAGIKILLSKGMVAQLKKFICKYGNEIMTTTNAPKGVLILPPASKAIHNECTATSAPRC